MKTPILTIGQSFEKAGETNSQYYFQKDPLVPRITFIINIIIILIKIIYIYLELCN
jgi:hypothetical protein